MTDAMEMQACACFNLRKAARAVTQMYDGVLRGTGLKATQFSLLAVAGGHPLVTMSELAEKMGMDRTTLTRNLKPLCDQGLVSIAQGNDPRAKSIALTDKGQAVFRQAAPLWKQAQARVVGKLGADKFGMLLERLHEIAAASRA